ncbi:MAG TPA: hypothetical protein VEH27_17135 [Methylomirabilota bacterium]|nr:hypothetical protein [Methylomirabilota bacterium]
MIIPFSPELRITQQMTTRANDSAAGEGDREATLFAMALEQPPAERDAFLQRQCAGDPGLLQRLRALLAAHSNIEEPLEIKPTPAPKATMEVRLPAHPDPLIGQKIGRYKILEKLGEGGCGVVFAAEQIVPVRRRVAVKVIKLGMDTAAVVARFEAERQALAMMDHPHIAKVFDAGVTDDVTFQASGDSKETAAIAHKGRPYFVMELVRGIPITTYCDHQTFRWPIASRCSSRFATPFSTRIKKGSSIATSSHPTSWSHCMMVCRCRR